MSAHASKYKFCPKCGAEVATSRVPANYPKYNMGTGERIYHTQYKCPNTPRFFDFGHTNMKITDQGYIIGSFDD